MRLSTAMNNKNEEGTWPCSSFPYGADNTRRFINPSFFSSKQSEVQLEQTWTPGKRHCTVRQVFSTGTFSSPSTLEVLSLKYFLYDTAQNLSSHIKEGLISFSIKKTAALRFLTTTLKSNRFTLKAFHKNNC